MIEKSHHYGDEQMETIIGHLLRFGVFLAAGVVLLGGVIYLLKSGFAYPNYSDFKATPEPLSEIPQIILRAVHFDSRALIQLGLLILIATPISRVAFSVFAFFKQKDYFYTIVTLIVLFILLFSFFGG
jgi:uncharacterized membrane protein